MPRVRSTGPQKTGQERKPTTLKKTATTERRELTWARTRTRSFKLPRAPPLHLGDPARRLLFYADFVVVRRLQVSWVLRDEVLSGPPPRLAENQGRRMEPVYQKTLQKIEESE